MSVSEWSGDSGARVPGADVDATGSAAVDPERSATASGNDGSGRMVAEVARALGYAGVSPFEIEDFKIEDVADRLHRAGFRLVSEDEATVERVARAMFEGEFPKSSWDDGAGRAGQEVWRGWARAAVRALREGGAS